MIPEENRFVSDHEQALPADPRLPRGWRVDAVDPGAPGAPGDPGASGDPADVDRLVALLAEHERAGRGWASATREDVLVEVSEHGVRMRENVVVRDEAGLIRAWGSVHDRAAGRMLLRHVVDRGLASPVADRCAEVLFGWAGEQAREVGLARGTDPQQIDTGAFAADERQHAWLRGAGYHRARTWWQMSRPVTPDEAGLVPSPAHWEREGVVFRQVARADAGAGPGQRAGQRAALPEEQDLRAVHQVLEGAFTDHFNSREELFAEFVHRLREDPGHRWDHWWLAELVADGRRQPVGALVGSVRRSTGGSDGSDGSGGADGSGGSGGPDGSYVDYLGVLADARGRGVATGLLHTIISDAASRGRDRVGLEVDADSGTGADQLYLSMGWTTRYVTESWHRDVPLAL